MDIAENAGGPTMCRPTQRTVMTHLYFYSNQPISSTSGLSQCAHICGSDVGNGTSMEAVAPL